jgi:DNA-binding LacI/PurR family transcriptional regulator
MLSTTDVAREAGVSRATVSYVLNDRRDVRVSEDTRRRVLDVARRLGYSGSPAARALRTGRGDVVLLLIPGWEVAGQLELLLEEIGRLVAQHGLVCLRYEGPHWQGSLHKLLSRIPTACVVTLSPLGDDDTHALASAGIPEVTAWLLDQPGQSHTTTITQAAIVSAQVDHLLDQGYQRLAYLAIEEPRGHAFTQARITAFQEICRTRGVTQTASATVASDLDSITRTLQTWTAPSSDPLGIAAWNDLTGLAILSAAAANGINIPSDLGVIGGDDTPHAALTHPTLSSVRFNLPAEAVGIAAQIAAALNHPIDHPNDPNTAAVEVMARESTGTTSR